MNFHIPVFLVLLISLSSDNDSSSQAPQGGGPRVVNFSGFDWIVARSGNRAVPPGPNYFSNSADNVWVDSMGRLHLRITYHNGRWECAGVILRGAKSYGRYIFRVSSEIGKLNENVVAGLFLYRDDHNEADIEFSRWGNPLAPAGQYGLQPSDREGNMYRFSLENAGKKSIHIIDWQPESVAFSSYRDYSDAGNQREMFSEWEYRGEDIPDGNRVKVMINLWLFRGDPPSDQKEVELIIESLSATICADPASY